MRAALLALVCVALGFFLTTPFFFLDFATVWRNLAHETRSEHLGADGLGFLDNLRWYVTSALPASMPDPVLVLAALGALHAALRRNVPALLVVASIASFLVAISAASLHWQRWLIQVLPLVSLLAAGALVTGVRFAARRMSTRPALATVLLVLATALLSAGPALAYLQFARALGSPSTRVGAREWMIANLPPGSSIAGDFYSAPLHDSPLHADYHFSLATDASLEEYRREGYDYLMVSDAIYGRFSREPARYPKEVAFYQELFRTGRMVMRFSPRDYGHGPVITVYALKPEAG